MIIYIYIKSYIYLQEPLFLPDMSFFLSSGVFFIHSFIYFNKHARLLEEGLELEKIDPQMVTDLYCV